MAIEQQNTTTYMCDRCGHFTTNPYDLNAQMNMKLERSAIGVTGDVGGAVIHKWLCGQCCQDFDTFMQKV